MSTSLSLCAPSTSIVQNRPCFLTPNASRYLLFFRFELESVCEGSTGWGLVTSIIVFVPSSIALFLPFFFRCFGLGRFWKILLNESLEVDKAFSVSAIFPRGKLLFQSLFMLTPMNHRLSNGGVSLPVPSGWS